MSDGPHGVRREISRDSRDFVQTGGDYSTDLPHRCRARRHLEPALAHRFGEDFEPYGEASATSPPWWCR